MKNKHSQNMINMATRNAAKHAVPVNKTFVEESPADRVSGRIMLMAWGLMAGVVIFLAATQDETPEAKAYMSAVSNMKAVAQAQTTPQVGGVR